MTGLVEPRLLKGLRDLMPEEMLARQWMVDTIRGVYELYGFVPLSTPAIEYLDVLRGSEAGDEAQKGIFLVQGPERDERLGLRFDLTVPLARVVSQYRDLPTPFRRYQVSSVWRGDKPGPGRFREFTQFDLDSVGVASEIADTEIIAGMCDTLEKLDVGGYKVRFSSRGLLNLLLVFAEVPAEQGVEVLRVLDKLDKVGPEKVRRELTTGFRDESGDEIRGVGLASGQVDRIERFLAVRGDRRAEIVGQLRELFAGVPGADEEIGVVDKISHHLAALGYPDDRAALDLSIARGLAYYTGPVFEAILTSAPEFGSVFGGGRYDFLVERFLGRKVPATGASIGVDRLLAALVHLGRTGKRRATADVLVTVLDPALAEDCLALTFTLRRAGIPAELYLGDAKGVGKQLKYADQTGVPIALLYGSNEKEQGMATLKDLGAGKATAGEIGDRGTWLEQRPGQVQVPVTDLVASVRSMLAAIHAAATRGAGSAG